MWRMGSQACCVVVLLALGSAVVGGSIVARKEAVNAWSIVPVKSSKPPPSAFHSTTSSSFGQVFQFGGINAVHGNNLLLPDIASFSDETWVLETSTLQWNKLANVTQSPSARAGHVAEALMTNGTNIDGNFIIIFGGAGRGGFRQDAWLYPFELQTWFPLVQRTPKVPDARWLAGSFVLDNDLYLWGGCHDFKSSNLAELWRGSAFDTAGGFAIEWNVSNVIPDPEHGYPTPRCGHVMQKAEDGVVVVAGGWDSRIPSADPLHLIARRPLNDTWRLLYTDTHPRRFQWFKTTHSFAFAVAPSVTLTIDGAPHVAVTNGFQFSFGSLATLNWYSVAEHSTRFYDNDRGWVFLPESSVFGTFDSPLATVGHTATAVKNEIILVSGYDTFDGALSPQFRRGSLGAGNTISWSRPEPRNSPAPSSQGMAVAFTGLFYFIGGWSTRLQNNSNVWVLPFENEQPFVEAQRWVEEPGVNFPPTVSALPIAIEVPGTNTSYIDFLCGQYQDHTGRHTFFNRVLRYKENFFQRSLEIIQFGGTSKRPDPRAAGIGGHHARTGLTYYFGGQSCARFGSDEYCENTWDNMGFVYLDDLWTWHHANKVWREVNIVGTANPPGRAFGAGAVLNDAFYIYGGHDDNKALGDMWRFDIHNSSWTLLFTTAPPGPRTFMCVGVSQELGSLVISAGAASYPIGLAARVEFQAWVFNTNNEQWYSLNYTYASPLAEAEGRQGVEIGETCILQPNTTNLYSFGGQSDGTSVYASNTWRVSLGCNPGHRALGSPLLGCEPCPLGTYGSGATTECTQCPHDTTTVVDFATDLSFCNTCAPGICKHGTCTLSQDSLAVCSCDFGYLGTQCSTHVLAIAAVSIASFILLCLLLYLSYRYLGGQIGKYKVLSDLKERLLDERQLELQELKAVWQISEDEVHLKHEIAEGSFGKVWYGEWQHRPVAVKQLHQRLVKISANVLDDFQGEIQLLTLLRHTNIVYFYGAGNTQTTPFIVMEYCERGCLHDLLIDLTHQLSIARSYGFALDAARGMQFLHKKNRVHRDLKSLNLLVSSNWVVKVTDFGTGKLLQELGGDTSARHNSFDPTMTSDVGTMPWSAPEILSGGTSYSNSIDIYSFGIVLWEIGSRLTPYENIDNQFELRERVIAGMRPQQKDIPIEFSTQYVQLMVECWQANPQARPTFDTVVNALSILRKKHKAM